MMALDVTYYSNAGNSLDLSLSVSFRNMGLMLSNIPTYFCNQFKFAVITFFKNVI